MGVKEIRGKPATSPIAFTRGRNARSFPLAQRRLAGVGIYAHNGAERRAGDWLEGIDDEGPYVELPLTRHRNSSLISCYFREVRAESTPLPIKSPARFFPHLRA